MKYSQGTLKFKKGAISLLIVILIVLMLSLVGWTLVKFISADFAMSSRTLDSERALYLAEAGMDWALNRMLATFDCDLDGDSSDIDNGTMLHSMEQGEYRLNCVCEDADCAGIITVESTGYIASESDYRAMRKIEVTINPGGFGNTCVAKNKFDWSAVDSDTEIDGTVQVMVEAIETTKGFEGTDADTIYNEPEDLAIPGDGDRIAELGYYPEIDMDYFKAIAQTYSQVVDYSSTAIVSITSSGDNLIVSTPNFFGPSMVGEAIRITSAGWGDENWTVITAYNSSTSVDVELKSGILDNINTWSTATVMIVKRFEGNHNNEDLWYIQGSDVLIDVRSGNSNINHTSIVAEGDIVIKGTGSVNFVAHVITSSNQTMPNLATKDGDIISLDTPSGPNKSDRREFDGLIYTQNGDIDFNYADGVAFMANNIYLAGEIELDYTAKYVSSEGFSANLYIAKWQEK